MSYDESIDYLYALAPLFQNVGGAAYKEGLSNTIALDNHFGNPHRRYSTIHVAGTNGKGSVSHTLAAILQAAGYKVGLYTSPHLVDFRERIRVNGEMIPKHRVVDFVEQEKEFFAPLHPSFFEIATALAFQYFAEQEIDVAVIEVGLGGRLDCTNIITPILSIITNISLDHTQFLGHTVESIATEKAGIIKDSVPVVVGECMLQPDVRDVFVNVASQHKAPLLMAEDDSEIIAVKRQDDGWHLSTRGYGELVFSLNGDYQIHNAATILSAIKSLRLENIGKEAVAKGFKHVCEMTGLQGRWQKVQDNPTVICDTGHNAGGWTYLSQQLSSIKDLHVVIGMVNDKDVNHVLSMMPRHAQYYYTAASVKRAMPADEFACIAKRHGLVGTVYGTVSDAVAAAIKNAPPSGTVFVGGSTFVVADYFTSCV